MSDLIVSKSRLEGSITPPPSLELAYRFVWVASLGGGGAIGNLPNHPDIKSIFNLATLLGADIKFENSVADIFGADGPKEERSLICYESSRVSRLALPLAVTFSSNIISLKKTKVPSQASAWLDGASAQLQIRVSKMNDEISVSGPPQNSWLELYNRAGAYWLPGFALALPLHTDESMFALDDFTSTHPSFYHTLETYRVFQIDYSYDSQSHVLTIPGLQTYPSRYIDVPASWKEASYYLGAFILAGKGEVKVSENSLQPEKEFWLIFNISKSIFLAEHGESFHAVSNTPFNLPKIIDLRPHPALIPLIILLATQAKEEVEISPLYPISPLSKKRAEIMASELTKLGAKIEISASGIRVYPSNLSGGSVDSHGDCRVAMALILAGLISKRPVQIQNWQAALKTNKNFISDLKKLGAKIEV